MGKLRTLKNLYIDLLTQRTFLGGRVKSIDGIDMVYDSVSTGYDILNLIFFQYYILKPEDVLVDVGCAKGRVFNYLLYKGLRNKMIGYEINTSLAAETKRNLQRYKNVEIIAGNIFDQFPKNANVFYLFNPFKTAMMEQFKAHILGLKHLDPVMLYYNPTCLDVFDNQDFDIKLIDVPILFFGLPYKLAMITIRK